MNLVKMGMGIVSNVLDRVITDKNARAEAQEALETLDKNGELDLLVGQLEINKEEAKHSSIFVSGWRPFIGWTCGFGLAYNFILYPILKFVVAVSMDMPPELPVLESGELMTLLLGMLGLAGYRTYEKQAGVSRNGAG